jgi:predicted RNA-binding Zn-ribbon protein involved in translation (DUF1610 family)
VHVDTFLNYIDANIILGRLESEGINGWLRDENTVTIDPILTNAIGGIKLMVPEVQAERAIALLKEYKREQQSTHPCPKCGSTDTQQVTTPRKASNWFGVLLGALTLNYPLSSDTTWHCFSCGNEFE